MHQRLECARCGWAAGISGIIGQLRVWESWNSAWESWNFFKLILVPHGTQVRALLKPFGTILLSVMFEGVSEAALNYDVERCQPLGQLHA